MYPLTSGQRWLLHVAQHPESLSKAVQRVYRLPPGTDTAALLASFRHVVTHREALRLQLVESDDGWRERFPEREATIAGAAVRGASAADREAYVRRALIEAANHTFDLTDEPPFRAKVFAFDDRLLLTVSVDHLAVDEIGFDRLERDWEDAYRRDIAGDEEGRPANGAGAFIEYVEREAAGRRQEDANLDSGGRTCSVRRSRPASARVTAGFRAVQRAGGFGALISCAWRASVAYAARRCSRRSLRPMRRSSRRWAASTTSC